MTKFKDKMNSYKKHPGSFLLFLLVVAAAIITVAVLLYLVAYILIHGVPYLKPGLFALEYNSDNVSCLLYTSQEWEILRVGADFRLKCMGCDHQIMIARKLVEKNTKGLRKKNEQKNETEA